MENTYVSLEKQKLLANVHVIRRDAEEFFAN
jgi:hypothetical protein